MDTQEIKSKRWKLSLKGWAERREMIQKAAKEPGRTLTDVGEEFGISRQRVKQIVEMQPPWEE